MKKEIKFENLVLATIDSDMHTSWFEKVNGKISDVENERELFLVELSLDECEHILKYSISTYDGDNYGLTIKCDCLVEEIEIKVIKL